MAVMYRNLIPVTLIASSRIVLVPYTSILSLHSKSQEEKGTLVQLITGLTLDVQESRLQLAKDLDVMISRNNADAPSRKDP